MMLVPTRLGRKSVCILFKPFFATRFHDGLDERDLDDCRDVDLEFFRAPESFNIEHQRNLTFWRCYQTMAFHCNTFTWL